jgi:hypothetical protein
VDARNLSATGAQLLLDPAEAPGGSAVRVRLRADGRSVEADLHIVRRSPLNAGLVEIGARFGDLSIEARQLISMAAIRELSARADDLSRLLDADGAIRTADEAYIRKLLHLHGLIEGRAFSVFDGHQRLSSSLHLLGVEADGGRTYLRMRASRVSLRVGDTYRFLVPGTSSVALFEAPVHANDGNNIIVRSPREIVQTGFRDSHRALLLPSERLTATFPHPRLVGVTLSQRLLDVAARGLSFLFDPATDFLFPEDRLSDVTLHLPGGTLNVVGHIRRMVANPADGSFVCGIEITDFAGPADRERWHSEVFRRTHPNLRQPDQPQHTDQLWRVLDESKYVEMWTPQPLREYLRREFVRVWNAVEPRSTNAFLIKHVRRASERTEDLVGTLAATLVYPRTCIIHHLGIELDARTGDEKTNLFSYLRELYSGVLYGLRYRAGAQHLLMYMDADSRFNRLVYGDFVERVSARGDLLYDPFQVFRCVLDTPAIPHTPVDGLKVVPSTRDMLTALSEHLRRTLPRQEFEAYAYDAGHIDLASFAESCHRAGYERSRRVFHALKDGVPVAALVADSGDEGMNLFGLMNTSWTFELVPGALREALPALVQAARDHYRRLGKKQFLYLEYAQEPDPFLATLGLRFFSPALRWLSDLRIMPAWLAYLEETFKQRVVAPNS